MPREFHKRGRRGEAAKRKLESHDSVEQETPNKRARTEDAAAEYGGVNGYEEINCHGEVNGHQNHSEFDNQQDGFADNVFYGLLDEQESEYFRRADEMLETNQFSTPEERNLFLANIFKEAEGKELKMACSQSCSRLLEKLIMSSAPDLLKKLFQAFSGQ